MNPALFVCCVLCVVCCVLCLCVCVFVCLCGCVFVCLCGRRTGVGGCGGAGGRGEDPGADHDLIQQHEERGGGALHGLGVVGDVGWLEDGGYEVVVKEELGEGVGLAGAEVQTSAFRRSEDFIGAFIDALDHTLVRVIVEDREAHTQVGVGGHLCIREWRCEGVQHDTSKIGYAGDATPGAKLRDT